MTCLCSPEILDSYDLKLSSLEDRLDTLTSKLDTLIKEYKHEVVNRGSDVESFRTEVAELLLETQKIGAKTTVFGSTMEQDVKALKVLVSESTQRYASQIEDANMKIRRHELAVHSLTIRAVAHTRYIFRLGKFQRRVELKFDEFGGFAKALEALLHEQGNIREIVHGYEIHATPSESSCSTPTVLRCQPRTLESELRELLTPTFATQETITKEFNHSSTFSPAQPLTPSGGDLTKSMEDWFFSTPIKKSIASEANQNDYEEDITSNSTAQLQDQTPPTPAHIFKLPNNSEILNVSKMTLDPQVHPPPSDESSEGEVVRYWEVMRGFSLISHKYLGVREEMLSSIVTALNTNYAAGVKMWQTLNQYAAISRNWLQNQASFSPHPYARYLGVKALVCVLIGSMALLLYIMREGPESSESSTFEYWSPGDGFSIQSI
ncbi:hypothetical protein CPB83DRAFT_898873 [Crepidotus variabilis]|uniref:Uncharacterized protein n=1 Tax=Crepidotus variabilis TaxID=179855 RepID=A0A9P6JJY8_9AGAR|nr:hypothetical protein CPB83DRAFT_898873 [Crepidotus variabilis]